MSDNNAPIAVGSTIADRYQIRTLLGRGGSGDVFLACDTLLDDLVALKVLHPASGKNNKSIARFLREIQLSRVLIDPYIVRTLECGQLGSRLYFTMEYIEGFSLRNVLRQISGNYKICTYVLESLLNGLSAIHQNAVIHRDLKPENVLISRQGSVKITDFGIARIQAVEDSQDSVLMGSMAYLAPELWQSKPLTASADIYSLGIVLYEMLTGKIPFATTSAPQVMYMHLHGKLEMPVFQEDSLPTWLTSLIRKMLAKDPSERPSSEALLAIIRNETQSSGNNASLQGCADLKSLLVDLCDRKDFDHQPAAEEPLSYAKRNPFAKITRPSIIRNADNDYGQTAEFDLNKFRRWQQLGIGAVVSLFAFAGFCWLPSLVRVSPDEAVVWLNTDALPHTSGSSVAEWPAAKIGSVYQTEPNFQPRIVLDPSSGRPLLNFDGQNDFLDASALSRAFLSFEEFTLLFVANLQKPDKKETLFTILSDEKNPTIFQVNFDPDQHLQIALQADIDGKTQTLDSNMILLNGLAVYTITYSKKEVLAFQNGRPILNDKLARALSLSKTQRITIGQEGSSVKSNNFYGGAIGDLVVFDRALNDQDRSQLEQAIYKRYQLQPLRS